MVEIMKLWHEKLIPLLPVNQLRGQNRECCALRGKGWNKTHFVVQYVFNHSPLCLYSYHKKVMDNMITRQFKVDPLWCESKYRGLKTEPFTDNEMPDFDIINNYIYPEHDDKYLLENLLNLRRKGIELPTSLWDQCYNSIGFSECEKLIELYNNAVKAGDTTNIQKIFYSWIK
jgi:uncharacterized protein (TIGR02328 family)